MVLKPFSGRFLSFPVHLVFLETQTLQMISTVGLPGSPEETEKTEVNRNKRITSGLPKHKILWKIWRVGGVVTRFSFKYVTVENNSTFTALFGHCLPGCYVNKTSSTTQRKNESYLHVTSWVRKSSRAQTGTQIWQRAAMVLAWEARRLLM